MKIMDMLDLRINVSNFNFLKNVILFCLGLSQPGIINIIQYLVTLNCYVILYDYENNYIILNSILSNE